MNNQLVRSVMGHRQYATVALVLVAIAWLGQTRLDAAKPSQSVAITATTPASSDLQILGVWVDSDDGVKVNDGSGTAYGSADSSNVIINRPSPAVLMDFLETGNSTLFPVGTTYSTDGRGTIAIQKHKRNWVLRYFFRGPGFDGTEVHYRLDGDITITSGNESSFPTGGETYTVEATNLRVSVDTGKKGNGYAGNFLSAKAIIEIIEIKL